MNTEEENNLFATAESDARNSARAERARQRIEGRLKDRTKKRNKLLKKGRRDLEPWLRTESLAELEGQLRDIDATHHRKSRSDRAVRQDNKALKPVALKHLAPGVIIDCWVPFVDSADYKRRPAVVVSADEYDVRVFPLTSSLGHRRLKTPIHVLENWQEEGLSRPTGMQRRVVVIARTSILGVSGELTGDDRQQFYAWVNSDNRTAANASHVIAAASHLPVA